MHRKLFKIDYFWKPGVIFFKAGKKGNKILFFNIFQVLSTQILTLLIICDTLTTLSHTLPLELLWRLSGHRCHWAPHTAYHVHGSSPHEVRLGGKRATLGNHVVENHWIEERTSQWSTEQNTPFLVYFLLGGKVCRNV